MYPTNQLSQIAWPLSYPTMAHPDTSSSVFPITPQVDLRGAPFIPVLQSLYESQDIYYGMRLQAQHDDADSHASQEYIYTSGAADAHHGAILHPHQTDAAPRSDIATSSKQDSSSRDRRPSHLRHQTSMDFQKEMLRNRDMNEIDNENTFIDWVYPPPEPSPARSFIENTMQWGTDSTFDNDTAGTQRRVRVKHMTQFQLKLMPDEEDEEAEEEDEDEQDEEQEGQERGGDTEYLPSADSRSSRAQSPASSAPKRAGRASRSSPKKTQVDNAKPGAGSSSAATREPTGPRKRLTIEQKRSNHIRHEKKRRGLIRDRFHDLTELVPELRGGTWSRSKILLKAVEYLQSLLEKNEALQEELDALKANEQNMMMGLSPTGGFMPPGMTGSGQSGSRRVQ